MFAAAKFIPPLTQPRFLRVRCSERSAVIGAFLNVKMNAAGLKDRAFAEGVISKGAEIERKAVEAEAEILSTWRPNIQIGQMLLPMRFNSVPTVLRSAYAPRTPAIASMGGEKK